VADSRKWERTVILPGITDTERLVRSPIVANKEQVWMAVSKRTRWCTRHVATSIKFWVECAVFADREMAPYTRPTSSK
jgi:hypothetical protein